MKTFSELKKDLKIGVKLKVVYHAFRKEQEGNIKTITRTQSNAIYTSCEQDRDGKEIRLEYPLSANLVEYENNIFTFYDIGKRDLNATETKFLELAKKEMEARPYDNPYFIKLSLAKQLKVEYMVSSTLAKRYSSYENKVYDSAVRGEKFISFEIIE